jgi:MATE family multidrug resistance protein
LFGALFYYDEIKDALFWPTWDETQWQYIKNFLGLGVPSLFMSFLEITGVELFQPLSGLISVNSNSAQAIVMVIYAGIFIIFMGISIASSIFIGRCVGQFNIQAAKTFSKASLIYVLLLTLVMFVTLWVFNADIVALYTSDPEIQALAVNATYVLLVAVYPVAIVYSQVGTLRGLGKQRVAASIQILSLFLISLPIGCYLAFVKEMNISGFWIGFLFRTIIAAAVFLLLIWRVFDWDEIAREIRDRERLLRERMIGQASPSKKPSDYGSIN